MRKLTFTKIAAIAFFNSALIAHPPAPLTRVSVCVRVYTLVNPATLARAEHIAMRIYGDIGIDLRFSCERASEDRSIDLGIRDQPARAYKPDALALAHPFAASGERITVLLDRIRDFARREYCDASSVLGHAIAHELGHVLEASNVHSMTGLMRARWTSTDLAFMSNRNLGFQVFDAEMIRKNLAAPAAPVSTGP